MTPWEIVHESREIIADLKDFKNIFIKLKTHIEDISIICQALVKN